MKHVILSADSEWQVYSVPDMVADHLAEYCTEFCGNWVWNGPEAERYVKGGGVCYDERDFIAYLNQYRFLEEPSVFVKNLGWIEEGEDFPEEYRDCPYFNF